MKTLEELMDNKILNRWNYIRITTSNNVWRNSKHEVWSMVSTEVENNVSNIITNTVSLSIKNFFGYRVWVTTRKNMWKSVNKPSVLKSLQS